ncbi:hypothetical protein BH24ACT15_BH24ACT15_05350 [soil metagenome]
MRFTVSGHVPGHEAEVTWEDGDPYSFAIPPQMTGDGRVTGDGRDRSPPLVQGMNLHVFLHVSMGPGSSGRCDFDTSSVGGGPTPAPAKGTHKMGNFNDQGARSFR